MQACLKNMQKIIVFADKEQMALTLERIAKAIREGYTEGQDWQIK